MPAARRSSAAAPIATSRCPTRSARASTPRSRSRPTAGSFATPKAATARIVNGQKIDEATVVDGNTIRVGSAEFEFHESEEPPTAKGDDPQLMQTIVQDMPIAVQESHEEALAGLPSTEQVKELMLLYQLCIKLLGCGDPNRVVEIALDLLRKRTGRLGRRLPVRQRRRRPAAQARDSPRRGRPRDAQPIAHRARFAARARRVGRQSGVEGRDGHAGIWATLPTPSAHRWCAAMSTANGPRSARSTSIWKTAASANPISISSSRWPTSWRLRSCEPARSPRCKATISGWSRSRPATTS